MISDARIWKKTLYIWLNGYLDIVPKNRRNQISPDNFLKKLYFVLKVVISGFIKLFVKNKIPKNKVWFYTISLNNYNAFVKIQNEIEESIFVSPYSIKSNKDYQSYSCNFRFKILSTNRYSLPS